MSVVLPAHLTIRVLVLVAPVARVAPPIAVDFSKRTLYGAVVRVKMGRICSYPQRN